MKIVIDIPKQVYDYIRRYEHIANSDVLDIKDAIINSTPLPKGHGDLIDRNKIEYMKAIHDLKYGKITASECVTKIKYSAPTIIEKDRE